MVLINIQHFFSVLMIFYVQLLSRVQIFATLWTATCQASHLSQSPRVCSNLCLVSQWCYPTISSSALFSSCLPSFPASRSIPESRLFASGGQSIGVSASVLPMKIQCCFPLWLIGLISLLSKGLSRVFFNTTIRKHQFFGVQPSLQSNSHTHTWLLEKP